MLRLRRHVSMRSWKTLAQDRDPCPNPQLASTASLMSSLIVERCSLLSILPFHATYWISCLSGERSCCIGARLSVQTSATSFTYGDRLYLILRQDVYSSTIVMKSEAILAALLICTSRGLFHVSLCLFRDDLLWKTMFMSQRRS